MKPSTCLMALDIGEKRCGIAACDAGRSVAFPVKTLPVAEVVSCAKSFRDLLEDYEPECLVVGLPLTLAGEEGPQALRVRKVAEKVQAACGLPVEFFDERLSSASAKRILREQGISERKARGRIDEVAASLVLSAYLGL